jgi:hypothetical protein
LAAGFASGQIVQVQLPPAPYYVGDPIDVQVVADKFDEDPTPSIEIPAASQALLKFRGVSPNVSTSITIVNGQVTRLKEVRFVYAYQLRVDRPGPVTIGPFAVVQGGKRRVSKPVHLDVKPVPTHGNLGVRVILPETTVYLGERVPVQVEFRLSGSLRENLHRYTLRVPLFDMTEQFRFLESPEPGETDVELTTAAGDLKLKGDARVTRKGGDQELIVTVTRIAVPLKEGVLNLPPATLDVEEGTRFRRDLFGGRKPTRVRRWRATDRPKRFRIERIPTTAKTPPGFAGAVGTGLSLQVTADRTVVQVGDPITLTLELRGDGNLETAALAPLDAPGMLPPAQFRVPAGELAGRVEDGVKTFTATVRVVDREVREIPALRYAWFDPQLKEFQTTQSRPIALSVRDAEVIGAAQVQRDAAAGSDASNSALQPGADTPARKPARLVLTGADLAIERDVALLSRSGAGESGRAGLVWGLYLGTLILLVAAFWDRRRRDVDPALVARKRRASEHLASIRAAETLPAAQAAAAIAAALRALVAERPEANRPEVDALLGACDARSFAPHAGRDAAPLEPALLSRALDLATGIVEGTR